MKTYLILVREGYISHQDMKNGRLTEIDYLNGAISKLGKKHNIQTPVCDAVTLMIHAKEFIRGNK